VACECKRSEPRDRRERNEDAPCERECKLDSTLLDGRTTTYVDFERDFGAFDARGNFWNVRSGSTDSAGTGPDHDHTSGPEGTGHYAYFEASNGREGDDGYMLTPNIMANQATCIEFAYHMYGSNIGTLSVLRIHDGTSKPNDVLFSVSGAQGRDWLQAKIDVPSASGRTYLKIIGERGDGYAGDMAIDDFIIWEDSCST